MKIPLLLLGLFLASSAVSQAGPVRGGFSGRGFHGGVGARGFNPGVIRGGGFNRGGFQGQGRFTARRDGFHRNFADRRFARNRVVFVQPFVWPFYGYPWYDYQDPLAYSYLEPDSQSDYQYWDNSASYVQPQRTNNVVPQNPVVVVINTGNPRPTDFSGVTGPKGNVYNDYVSTSALGQQRVVVQDPNEHDPTGAVTPGDPVDPPPTAQNERTVVQPGPGVFGKFVIVNWLQDRGKDVITLKNIETNAVQRVTSQPNIDHLRIVEVHPNPDLRQSEAIISNGSDQGPVRFQF